MGRARNLPALAAAAIVAVAATGVMTLAGPAAQAEVGFRDVPFGTIAWTGSTAVIAETGTNGDLYYWYDPGGNTSWHGETVATATSKVEYSDASIAWTGTYSSSASSVVIAAEGGNGDIYYWWQAAGTTQWHKQTVASSGPYFSTTIGTTSDSVVIAASDRNGNEQYWYQPFGATKWTHQKVAAGVDTEEFASASIGWTGSTVVIAGDTSSGDIFYWYNPGGDTSIGATSGATVISGIDNTDSPGTVDYYYQNFGTSPWNAQTIATGCC